MRFDFLVVLILLIICAGCNNPSGGSSLSGGNAPFLLPPAAFSFSQVRAVDGNVSLKWKESFRAATYKVFQGTSSALVNIPVSSCSPSSESCLITGLNPNL